MLFDTSVKTFQHRRWKSDGRKFKVMNCCILKKHWFTIGYLKNNQYTFEDRYARDILKNSELMY